MTNPEHGTRNPEPGRGGVVNPVPTHPAPEALELLTQVLRDITRARRLPPEDADDFTQSVHLRLLESDYEVFQRFNGQSSLRTYLNVVVHRLLLDWRNAMWGKWRASAAARRMGDAAVMLERLIHRDSFSTDEAIAIVSATRHAPPVDELAEALPPRLRRRMVSDEDLPDMLTVAFEDPLDANQRRRDEGFARQALQAAMERLVPEDRQLLRLRYYKGQSVQAISRTLRTDPKRLYRRFERVRRTLRRSLQASSTAGSGSTSGARSTMTRRTTTASETSATTPATNTARMLRAPTRPASTGLIATPIS
ncbi:MAG: sigma-70 family RNA polymerase sigma factor [Acidimicrobiia bacterium]|nr:sigma-70 family RNA polymerase sigma factor [Acidimicrobiia bacterium]